MAKTESKPSLAEKLPRKVRKLPKLLKNIDEPFLSAGRYFKGSWQELKQVRWPDRKSTWAMIFAVLIFSGFFVALIKLLDVGFDELFNLVIK